MKRSREAENKPVKKNSIQKIVVYGSRYIDYKMGIYGAIFLGTVVFIINFTLTGLWLAAGTAALKQGCYTFLFGGIIMRFCEYLAINIKRQTFALMAAILIPTTIALSLTFGIHNLKGTPKPIASTIPTLLIIPATAVVAYKKRISVKTFALKTSGGSK